MPSKSKKQHSSARARKLVKGLQISWEDRDPLSESSEVIPGEVTHSNPLLRLTAEKVFRDFGDYITQGQVFLWRVELAVIFLYANGLEQSEKYELVAKCKLSDVNDQCLELIQAGRRAGADEYYLTTRFTVECLGDRQHCEQDFQFDEVVG